MNDIHPEAAGVTSSVNSMLAAVISNTNRDMRFVGIMTIIYGVIPCLTIIGAIVGIPIIISGIRLREAADFFERYIGSGDLNLLQAAIEKQGRFFFIQKIFIIISLVAIGLMLFAMVPTVLMISQRYGDY